MAPPEIDVDLVMNLLNVAIFVAILVGVALHHRRSWHVRIMLSALVADVGLLLWVELANAAIAHAAQGGPGRSGVSAAILWIHIAFSVATLVFWVIQVRNGFQVLRGRYEVLPAHARNARIFLAVRFGNLVTAFLV